MSPKLQIIFSAFTGIFFTQLALSQGEQSNYVLLAFYGLLSFAHFYLLVDAIEKLRK